MPLDSSPFPASPSVVSAPSALVSSSSSSDCSATTSGTSAGSSSTTSAARSLVRLTLSVPSAQKSPRVLTRALPTDGAGARGQNASRPSGGPSPAAVAPAEGSRVSVPAPPLPLHRPSGRFPLPQKQALRHLGSIQPVDH